MGKEMVALFVTFGALIARFLRFFLALGRRACPNRAMKWVLFILLFAAFSGSLLSGTDAWASGDPCLQHRGHAADRGERFDSAHDPSRHREVETVRAERQPEKQGCHYDQHACCASACLTVHGYSLFLPERSVQAFREAESLFLRVRADVFRPPCSSLT